MKHLRHLALVTLASLALVAAVHADGWNKKTIVTIDQQVSVPSCCTDPHNVTLEPGTYVLMLVDSPSDRHIVRVYDKDQKHVITTVLAIPNYRLRPRGKTEFQFWETPVGQPKAIRAWFYPGDNFGQEFVYPKQLATTMAATANMTVPIAAPADAETTTEHVEIMQPSGTVVEPKTETAYVAPVEPAPVAAAPAPTPAPTPEPAPAELPHTASPEPLIGLIGLLSSATLLAMSINRTPRA